MADDKNVYKNTAKEMEMLLKLEGGMTPKDMRAKNLNPRNILKSREAAARVGGNPSAMSAPSVSYMPGTDDDDFELGAGGAESSQDMLRALTEKVGLPYRDIKDYKLEEGEKMDRLTSFIPGSTARELRVFPVDETTDDPPVLTVAIADPLDITIVDNLRLMLPEHEIEAVVIDEQDIIDAIDTYYGIGDEDIDEVIQELNIQDTGKTDDIGGTRSGEVQIDLEELASAPPVIKLVNLILIRAIKDRASDLHIEPFGGIVRIRYRVDGVLREIPSPPKSLQLGMMTRLKVMASLNISESRRPQDGRIRLNVEGREVDLRVACVPTVHGESIVMRVLDKSAMMIGIEQLGFQEDVLKAFLKRCRKPNGIVLVTGPTGSGKTTTLYATLREVFESGEKFITTEDPVEFELPGIVQVNINSKVGLTFAACLRAILRQDPDTILVGEIRDVETAQISIQAALTGHLVLSTLHTNSAAATITRLVDMGIQPFLLTSTMEAIVGQRLLRTICPTCKAPYFPTDEELEDFGVERDEVEDITFYQGRGCDDCNFSGYKGRIGIYEVMEVSESIKELIIQGATTDDIHAMAVHEGMVTLRQDGWLKICLGVTTFEEVTKHTVPETEESIKAEMESVRRSLQMIEDVQKKRQEEENFGISDSSEDQEEDIIQLNDPSLSGGFASEFHDALQEMQEADPTEEDESGYQEMETPDAQPDPQPQASAPKGQEEEDEFGDLGLPDDDFSDLLMKDDRKPDDKLLE